MFSLFTYKNGDSSCDLRLFSTYPLIIRGCFQSRILLLPYERQKTRQPGFSYTPPFSGAATNRKYYNILLSNYSEFERLSILLEDFVIKKSMASPKADHVISLANRSETAGHQEQAPKACPRPHQASAGKVALCRPTEYRLPSVSRQTALQLLPQASA